MFYGVPFFGYLGLLLPVLWYPLIVSNMRITWSFKTLDIYNKTDELKWIIQK